MKYPKQAKCLKDARRARGMSQRETAKSLGLNTPRICRLESGTHEATIIEAVLFNDFFGVKLWEVFSEKLCNQSALHRLRLHDGERERLTSPLY